MDYQTIISAEDLAENLNTPNWLILDCRSGAFYNKESYENYTNSHIPNAFYYSFSGNYASSSDLTPATSYDSTETDKIIDSLKEQGFSEASQIVLYDECSSAFANTLWLLLRSIGCKNVAVLQEGFSSWKEKKMPLSSSCSGLSGLISKKKSGVMVKNPVDKILPYLNAYKPSQKNKLIDQIYRH